MISVHIIKHPLFDRSRNLDRLLDKLIAEPVNVTVVDGLPGHIGKGRVKGFRCGNEELITYIDDDDDFKPGIFDKILECFEKEDIDALCTRENRISSTGTRTARFPFKYYDKRHLFRLHHFGVFKRSLVSPFIDDLNDLPDSSEHYLWAKLLLNNAKIRHLPIAGYDWYIHDQDSKSLNIKKPVKAWQVFKQLRNQSHAEMLRPHIEDQQLLKFV